MRFYVTDEHQHRIYVTFSTPIETRADIPFYFDIYCQLCGSNKTFSRNDVRAEAGATAAGGAIIGGLLGALAGPEGIIVGGIIGGILGGNAESEEQRRIRRFEQSW